MKQHFFYSAATEKSTKYWKDIRYKKFLDVYWPAGAQVRWHTQFKKPGFLCPFNNEISNEIWFDTNQRVAAAVMPLMNLAINQVREKI